MDYRLSLIKQWEKLDNKQREFLTELADSEENYLRQPGVARNRRSSINNLEWMGLTTSVHIKSGIIDVLTREGSALMYFVRNDWWLSSLNAAYNHPNRCQLDALRIVFRDWEHALQSDETVVSDYGLDRFKLTASASQCNIVAMNIEHKVDSTTSRDFRLPEQFREAVMYAAELSMKRNGLIADWHEEHSKTAQMTNVRNGE